MKYDYVFRELRDIRPGDTLFHIPHDLPVAGEWINVGPCVYLDEVRDRYPYGVHVRGILSKRPTITDDFLRRETWVLERLGCSGIDLDDNEIIHALQVATATVKAIRKQGYEVVP